MQRVNPGILYRILTAGVLSLLLLLPTAARFAHDFLEHHAHEICADELEGEVHYHPMEVECHFHPVYISPYSLGQIAFFPDIELEEPAYSSIIPKAVCTEKQSVVSLRGPPAV